MADYFGLPCIISVILLLFPLTSWICGILTRIKEGAIIAGIVRIVLGFNIIYLLDIVFSILAGCQPNIARIIQC